MQMTARRPDDRSIRDVLIYRHGRCTIFTAASVFAAEHTDHTLQCTSEGGLHTLQLLMPCMQILDLGTFVANPDGHGCDAHQADSWLLIAKEAEAEIHYGRLTTFGAHPAGGEERCSLV